MHTLRELKRKHELAAMEALLFESGIRYEAGMTYCLGLYEGEALIACGGVEGAVIKCLCVSPLYRGEAHLNKVAGALYTYLRQEGVNEVFVFTAPRNEPLFQSLGFFTLARSEEALLLTNDKNGMLRYLRTLSPTSHTAMPTSAAIVMNANPFTLGHRHLIEQAKQACNLLHIFVVEENKSEFSFKTRFVLVREGVSDLKNVLVHQGGPYIISAATFPSYFLKDATGAAKAHAEIDASIFGQYIAPALNIQTRFLGEEPLDPLTRLYNEALVRILPPLGIEVRIIKRKETEGAPISASRVRALLKEGRLAELSALVPESTLAYLQTKNA